MKIIIGLGNPGKKYAGTRHNIGFRIVEAFAGKHGLKFSVKKQLKAEVTEGVQGGQKFVLIKPQTFMNLSGEAVHATLNWHKASVLDMIVIYDDIDTEFKEVRFKEKGSSGGHNGIQSIITHVGTSIFNRLKFGVNRPPAGRDPADYVLAKFSKDEEKEIPEILNRAIEKIEEFLGKG